MKLTTKLSHARIRLKHQLLRLRLHNPVIYRSLFAAVLLLVIGCIASAYIFLIAPKDTKTYAEQFGVIIESYSLNGPITAVEGNSFTMQSSVVETTNGINSVKSITKKVSFTNTTAIYVTNINGTEVTSKTGSAADIAVGRNITVYTPEDPNKIPVITATKLEIVQ